MPHLARENTLASFGLALDAGADGIELDVHATADGVVVVHHDAALPSGARISELNHQELRREAPEAEHIPTLSSVTDLVRGRAELFVEIKGVAIERLVTAALAGYDGACAIHSFDLALILRLSRGGSAHRLGVLYDQADPDPVGMMTDHGALDLWPHYPLVTRELVDAVHSMRGRIIPWTVNSVRDAKCVAALGVDGVCTDDVSALPWR